MRIKFRYHIDTHLHSAGVSSFYLRQKSLSLVLAAEGLTAGRKEANDLAPSSNKADSPHSVHARFSVEKD